jgi:hypothetical protein
MRRITLLLLVAAAFHSATAAQPAVSGMLSPAWSLDGPWTGVATDEKTGVIRALGRDRIAEVNVDGRIRNEIALQNEDPFPRRRFVRTLRLGRFPRLTLVTFTTWDSVGVVAYGVRGERLWSYTVPDVPDDVWVSDVDGDKIDEVIVGYNGRGGVHVLDGQGRLRWKSTSISNVWKVAAGDVLGIGTSQVVTTSGGIHIFNGADGTGHQVIEPPRRSLDVVRVAKLRPEDQTATIFAADSKSGVTTAMALSGSGEIKWSVDFGGSAQSAAVASSRPWLALGTFEGDVHVIDAVRGKVIGLVGDQGSAEVGWAIDPPLLLVATGKALNAFRVGVD